MKFLFSLAAALLSLGLTQPALSTQRDSVVIVQCGVTGTAYEATAASESREVRDVVIGNSCARELELYLEAGFRLQNTQSDQNGFTLTYTLFGPQP